MPSKYSKGAFGKEIGAGVFVCVCVCVCVCKEREEIMGLRDDIAKHLLNLYMRNMRQNIRSFTTRKILVKNF